MEIGESVVVPLPAPGAEDKKPPPERKCPACGAKWTKTEPILAQVRAAIAEALMPFEEPLHRIEKGLELGYRGSIAAGRVGNPSKPHYGLEPDIRGECGNGFDVDGYVLSRETFSQIPKDKAGKRWAKMHAGLRAVETQMRGALASRPALAHMKKGAAGFELLVRHVDERATLRGKGPLVTLILGG